MSTTTIQNTLPALLSKAVSATNAEVDELPWNTVTGESLASMLDARAELDRALDMMVALEPTDRRSPLSSVTLDPKNKNVQRGANQGSTKVTSQALSQLVTELRKAPHAMMPNNTINVIRYLSPPAAKVAFDDMRDRRARGDKHPLVFRYIVVTEKQKDGTTTRTPVLRCVATETHTLDNGDLKAVLMALKVLSENGYGDDRYFLDGAKMTIQWAWNRAQLSIHFPATDNGQGGSVISLTLSETKASSWYTSVGVLIGGRLVNYSGLTHLTGRHVGTQVANKMIQSMKEARTSAAFVRESAEMADRVTLYKVRNGRGEMVLTADPDSMGAPLSNDTLVVRAINAMDNNSIPQAVVDALPQTFTALDLIVGLLSQQGSVEQSERLQKGADSIIDYCHEMLARQQVAA